MAIIFEMWAECATEAECAALARHFDGFQCTLLTGRQISWRAGPQNGLPTGMVVASGDLSRYGPRNLTDVLETTESGLHLYHHLKAGPSFRFARVAWEAELLPLAELHECIAPMMPGKCRLEVECAVVDEVYKELGSPEFCFPFRQGYWWTRYYGEKYSPLSASDQKDLNDRCRSLFPEYFRY
jgi:hypothetical protein